jgi:tetratricopeptide (TPR) repeat protein
MADSQNSANIEYPNPQLPISGSTDVEAELKLLRDQVDLLQIDTRERKRPWFKQVNSILSVIAVLFSGFTFAYSQIGQHAEDVRSKKKELRDTVAALIDLRGEFYNTQLQESESINLNNKRLIYVEAADTLITQIPNNVSWAEYAILAYEKQLDSNFTQAERYYQKAIEASRTPLGKNFSIRALAGLYFSQGPLLDFGKGRKHFGEAVDALKNPTDHYMAYTLGYTYEQWGLYELWNGFHVEGNQMIERARKYYLDPPDSPLKKRALESLNEKAKQFIKPNSMLPPAPLKPGE